MHAIDTIRAVSGTRPHVALTIDLLAVWTSRQAVEFNPRKRPRVFQPTVTRNREFEQRVVRTKPRVRDVETVKIG